MSKQFYFKEFTLVYVEFKCQIWAIDRTLSGALTPGKDGNKGVLCIPPNSSITGTS